MSDRKLHEAYAFETYHIAWLSAHPERTPEWLKDRLKDGFHVHHIDGDHSNDDPINLILVDGIDHLKLHSGSIQAGISAWREKARTKTEAAALQRAIYDAKAAFGSTWLEFAKSYYGGEKPSAQTWHDLGQALSMRARKFAGKNGLPWPPLLGQ